MSVDTIFFHCCFNDSKIILILMSRTRFRTGMVETFLAEIFLKKSLSSRYIYSDKLSFYRYLLYLPLCCQFKCFGCSLPAHHSVRVSTLTSLLVPILRRQGQCLLVDSVAPMALTWERGNRHVDWDRLSGHSLSCDVNFWCLVVQFSCYKIIPSSDLQR